MTPPETGHQGPGLQAERTSLASTRTCALMLAVDLLLIRLAPSVPMVVAAAIGAGLLPVGLLAAGRHRYRRDAQGLAEERYCPPVVLNVLLVLNVWSAAVLGTCVALSG